jgi:hypothetical protein
MQVKKEQRAGDTWSWSLSARYAGTWRPFVRLVHKVCTLGFREP